MILKLKQNDSWRFIDNVQDVVVPDALDVSNNYIQYFRNDEYINQNVSEGCYILNDNGRTVEKVC